MDIDKNLIIGCVKIPFNQTRLNIVETPKNKRINVQNQPQDQKLYNSKETQFIITTIFDEEHLFSKVETIDGIDIYCNLQALLQQFKITPFITIYSEQLAKLLNPDFIKSEMFENQVNAALTSISVESIPDIPKSFAVNMQFVVANLGIQYGSAMPNVQFYKSGITITSKAYEATNLKNSIEEEIKSNTSYINDNFQVFNIDYKKNISDAIKGMEKALEILKSLKQFRPSNTFNNENTKIDFDDYKRETIEKYETVINNLKNETNNVLKDLDKTTLQLQTQKIKYGYQNNVQQLQMETVSKTPIYQFFGRTNQQIQVEFIQKNQNELKELSEYIQQLVQISKYLQNIGKKSQITFNDTLTQVIGETSFFIDMLQYSNIDSSPSAFVVDIQLIEQNDDFEQDFIFDRDKLFQKELFKSIGEDFIKDQQINDQLKTSAEGEIVQSTNTKKIDLVYPKYLVDASYSKGNALSSLTTNYFDLYIQLSHFINEPELMSNFFNLYILNIFSSLLNNLVCLSKDGKIINGLFVLSDLQEIIKYTSIYCQTYNIDVFTALQAIYEQLIKKISEKKDIKNIFDITLNESSKIPNDLIPEGLMLDLNSIETTVAYSIQYMQYLKRRNNISNDDDIFVYFRNYQIKDTKIRIKDMFKINNVILYDDKKGGPSGEGQNVVLKSINDQHLLNFQRQLQKNPFIKRIHFSDFETQYLMKIPLDICNEEENNLINDISIKEQQILKTKSIKPFVVNSNATVNRYGKGYPQVFQYYNNISDFVDKITKMSGVFDGTFLQENSCYKNQIKDNEIFENFYFKLFTKYMYKYKNNTYTLLGFIKAVRESLLNKFMQVSHLDISVDFIDLSITKKVECENKIYVQDEDQLSNNISEKFAGFIIPKNIKDVTMKIVRKYINDEKHANTVASFFITQHLISKQSEINLLNIKKFIQSRFINENTKKAEDVDLKIKQYVEQLIDDNLKGINVISAELNLFPRLTNTQIQAGLMRALIEFEDQLYSKIDKTKKDENQLIYTNLLWLLNYLYEYPEYGFAKILKELDYNQFKDVDKKLILLFTSIDEARNGSLDRTGGRNHDRKACLQQNISFEINIDDLHQQFIEMKNALSEYQDLFLTEEQYTQLQTHYNKSQQQTNESKIGHTKDYFDNLKILYDENTFKNQIRNIVSSVYCISDFDITIDNLFQNIIDAYLEKSTENILKEESKKIIDKLQQNESFNLGYGLGFNPEKIFYKHEQLENKQVKEYSTILLKTLKDSILEMDTLLKNPKVKSEDFNKIYNNMLNSLKKIIENNSSNKGDTATTEFKEQTEAVENILNNYIVSISDINQVLGGTKDLYKIEESELSKIIEGVGKSFDGTSDKSKEELEAWFKIFESLKIYQDQYTDKETDNQQWNVINSVQQTLFGIENYEININIIQPKQSVIFLKRKVYENKQFNKKYFEYISKLFYKGIVNFSVSKSQESPQHQAIINLSNTSKSLLQQTSDNDFQKYIYYDFSSNSDIDFYSVLSNVFLSPGTELQIVAGYTSDIYKLPCVFQGVVTQVQDGGDTITITADGYGRDLLIPKANNKYSAKAKLYIDPSDMVLKAIQDSGSYVFGQFTGYLGSEENPVGTTIIQDSYEVINYSYQEKYRKLGINVYRPDKYYKQLYSTNRNDKTFILSDETKNNFKQSWTAFFNNIGFNFSNDITNNPYKPKSGYTPWDIITDAKLRVPNYIQYVDDFGIGSQRVFFGRPEWKQQTKPFIQKTEQKDFKEIKQKTDDIKSSWQNAFSEEFIVQQSIIYADFFPNANFLSKNKDKIKTVFEKIKKLKTEEFNVLKNNYIEQLNKISNDTELSSTKKVIDKIINYSKTKEIIKTNVQNIIAINLQQFDIEQSIEKISSKQDELQVMTLSFFKLLIQYSFCKQFDSIEDAINTSKKIDLNYEQTIIKNNKIPLQQSLDEYESMNLPVVYNNNNNYIEAYIDNIINLKKYAGTTAKVVNLMRDKISFKKTYLASTERNIISNNLFVDNNAVSNMVNVYGPCGFIDNKGFLGGLIQLFGKGPEKQEINGKKMKCVSQILDPRIPDTHLKAMTYIDENGYVTQVDKIIASNLLQSSLQNYYQGTITLIGCPTIKPYDELKIQDTNKNISGSVIVKEVITHFNSNTGFITQIVPQMKTEQTLPERLDSINYIWGDQLTLGVYVTMIGFALASTLTFGVGQIAFGSALFAAKKINSLTNDIVISPQDLSDQEDQSYTNRYDVFNSIKLLPLAVNNQELVPKFITDIYPKYDGSNLYIVKKNTQEYWNRISLGIANIGYNQISGTTNVLYDISKIFNFIKTDPNQAFNAQILKGNSIAK